MSGKIGCSGGWRKADEDRYVYRDGIYRLDVVRVSRTGLWSVQVFMVPVSGNKNMELVDAEFGYARPENAQWVADMLLTQHRESEAQYHGDVG